VVYTSIPLEDDSLGALLDLEHGDAQPDIGEDPVGVFPVYLSSQCGFPVL
jgi:hypothetical protein